MSEKGRKRTFTNLLPIGSYADNADSFALPSSNGNPKRKSLPTCDRILSASLFGSVSHKGSDVCTKDVLAPK
jgi:hypothetical protein